jgi:hypothetical protein
MLKNSQVKRPTHCRSEKGVKYIAHVELHIPFIHLITDLHNLPISIYILETKNITCSQYG